jgi:hypothetical protein
MKLRTTLLAGGLLCLAAGGAAFAASKMKTETVDLGNGSVAQVQYVGDVAPKVTVVPAEAQAVAESDPFARMDAMFAQMEAQRQQVMQQVAEMQRQAAASGAQANQGSGQVMVSTNVPAGGTYHYTVVTSTSSNGKSCTQTVEYSSDGKSAEPKMTRASSGDCDAVKPNDKPVPASAPAPVQPKAQPQPRDPNMI